MRRNKRWSITKISERLENAKTLEVAEQAAEDALGWAQCAKAWINQFANESRAEKCTKQAMLIADFPGAWIECLDVWLMLGNKDKAKMRRTCRIAWVIFYSRLYYSATT